MRRVLVLVVLVVIGNGWSGHADQENPAEEGLSNMRVPIPLFRSHSLSTSVAVESGETLVFQVAETTTDYLKPPGQEMLPTRPQFLVVTARAIGSDGRPLSDRTSTGKPQLRKPQNLGTARPIFGS